MCDYILKAISKELDGKFLLYDSHDRWQERSDKKTDVYYYYTCTFTTASVKDA